MKPAEDAGAGAGVEDVESSFLGPHLAGADDELVLVSERCGGPNGLKPADEAGAGAGVDEVDVSLFGVHFAGADDELADASLR